jgi:murein peptide amidase A
MRIHHLFSTGQPWRVGLLLSVSAFLIPVAQAADAPLIEAVQAVPAQQAKPATATGVGNMPEDAKPKPRAQPPKAKPLPASPIRSKANSSVGGGKPKAATGNAASKSATSMTPKSVVSIVPAIKPANLPAIGTPQDFCAQVTRTLPSVDLPLCARAQLMPTTGRSVWGRTIFQRDVISPSPQLRVLVIGGIHGDERSSSSLVLHWIQQAAQTPANVHWRFVPMINVDGMLISPPRRTNASGVDLNRNFPTPKWDKEAPVYWANRTKSDPRRYPGPKPLSEPESRWIHDEMERWKPQLIVSVHAPYAVLDFDGPAVPPQRLGRLYLDQVGIYPGSLGNFGGIHKRVPVVTIELPSATQMPSEAETRQMWFDLLRWMGERLGAG